MKETKLVVECPMCHAIINEEKSEKPEHRYELCDACSDEAETRRPIRRTRRNEFTI